VAKSFTISAIRYDAGSLAARHVALGLFAAVEDFKKFKIEVKK
jgi:hypothetical protein